MQNKIPGEIKELVINAPTYNNIVIKPSMINFFYGKNGTGKSTLAKAFKDGKAVPSWSEEEISEDCILVYNEDFIEKNVTSYGNIPGVFTISEVNAEKKKEADEKTARKESLINQAFTLDAEAKQIEENQRQEEEDFNELLWTKTKAIREKYPKTQDGFKKKKTLAEELLKTSVSDSEDKDCESLYNTVYGADKPRYDEYRTVRVIPVSELMKTRILSRSNTNFASFIRSLDNMGWVTEGHLNFHNKANGRCPYCQQSLPLDFEEKLASCYDEEYKKDIQKLNSFVDAYEQVMASTEAILESNVQNSFPTKLSESYSNQARLLSIAIKRNKELLAQKKANPSEEIILEDLSTLANSINDLASSINEEIRAYMTVLNDIPGQRKKCINMVWGMMAKECENEIKTRNSRLAEDRASWREKNTKSRELKEEARRLDDEIALLNSQTVNTTKAMNDINRLIASAGFIGFRLREKPGAKYVYELVRDINGNKCVIGQNLSEGERHFIAFLYFYHMVMGSQSDDGKQQNKIVVIDDPVSSMDSSSLFVVASLTREMIEVCYNNYVLSDEVNDHHILQFFCMTHNPYFFREVSFNHLSDYECVSIFEIKKNTQNQTSIKVCEEDSPFGGGKINYSPVKNTYDALWNEYIHTDNPESLMIVIRQILEYYFVQMVGYQNNDLRRTLLKDCNLSKEDQAIASAMISMINVGARGFNDGLYYDASAANIEHLRAVFKEIFYAMRQDQHYEMMTRT